MRGRVISVLLVLLSTSLPTLADCSWVSRYSGQFRSTVYDVAVDGEGFIWLATGYGVQLLEPIAGRGYALAGSVAVPGSTRVLALSGNLAYTGSGSRVYIVRRSGRTLSVSGSVDAGGTVNDIVEKTALFVATSNGIAHFDLIDPLHPFRTNVIITTSRANVSSLAVIGSTMYAADGDASVETINVGIPSIPQGTGALESLTRSSAVHAANNLLYVSDELGQSTDVFTGTTKLGRISYGTNAFATLTSDSIFAAGPQRVFRALDVGSLTRVAELYEQQLLPLGGTNNRIFAMARSGNTLFVAAGDMGLVTYDITTLLSPHPLASYVETARNSVATIGEKAYFAGATGISEAAINRSGISLTPQRTWDTSTATIVHDASGASLLSSNGSTIKVWAVDAATPSMTFSASLAANVRSALFTTGGIIAQLVNDTLWRIPIGGSPQQLTIDGPAVVSMTRSGNAIALLQVSDDAKTTVRYYSSGDLSAAPRTFTLDGAAIGGAGLSATHAAVFTFRGINLIDLATGVVRVLPGSNRTIPRQLLFSGTDLLVLGDATLSVWDTTKDALLRENPLPETPAQMQVTNGIAVIASNTGSMATDYKVALPKGVSTNGNRFYRGAAAAGSFLYLIEDQRVDVYSTLKGAAPSFEANISAPATGTLAALPTTLYATEVSRVTSYSKAGVQLAQKTLDDGNETTAIFAVGNAVWVAIVKGCSTGTCERKTYVLDPSSLAITATLNGGVVDVATSGSRAYALFALPDEMRILDITNPLQPSQVVSAASPANAASIGYSAGKVYVLADKVYSYNESLLGAGDFLDSLAASGDMAIEGDCAVVTGRAESPQLYRLPSWTLAPVQLTAPSTVKSIAQQAGKLFLLTEHSVEVWTTAPPPTAGKRRAAH